MGSYIFERSTGRGGSVSGLIADVERALGELDWVENFTRAADDGDGSVVLADVHFDPDWPDTANPTWSPKPCSATACASSTDHKDAGRVVAADPLRASSDVATTRSTCSSSTR
jgi:hypothetical protein